MKFLQGAWLVALLFGLISLLALCCIVLAGGVEGSGFGPSKFLCLRWEDQTGCSAWTLVLTVTWITHLELSFRSI